MRPGPTSVAGSSAGGETQVLPAEDGADAAGSCCVAGFFSSDGAVTTGCSGMSGAAAWAATGCTAPIDAQPADVVAVAAPRWRCDRREPCAGSWCARRFVLFFASGTRAATPQASSRRARSQRWERRAIAAFSNRCVAGGNADAGGAPLAPLWRVRISFNSTRQTGHLVDERATRRAPPARLSTRARATILSILCQLALKIQAFWASIPFGEDIPGVRGSRAAAAEQPDRTGLARWLGRPPETQRHANRLRMLRPASCA